jgi:GntR family transcriptional regulator
MALNSDTWSLDFRSGIPVYKQIIHHVQAAVTAGNLHEGDQLPTIRALHLQLGINPNTVARAYRDMELMGVITTEQGSGCYLAPAKGAEGMTEEQKKTKIAELAARFTAEAQSQGILFSDIVSHINSRTAP